MNAVNRFWKVAKRPRRGARTASYLIAIGLLLLAARWMLSGRSSSASPRALQPPAVSIPAVFFGLHIHHPSEAAWPSIPFAGLRLWDAYVTWSDLEPRKGEWNFKTLDNNLDIAAKQNVEILLTLGTPPSWASARPTEPPSFRPGGAAEPKDMEDWRNYVRSVATHCRGRVQAYEIWNEPNLKAFYSGTVDQMVALAKEAYLILHQVDPSVIVVSPSATGNRGVSWLDEYLRKGGGQYADVIGYHFYVTPKGPEAMVDIIARVRQTMAKYGVSSKPLWNTEAGWFIQNQMGDVKPEGAFIVLSSDEASVYVARAYILNWAAGVSRFYWYDWDSKTMALADGEGRTPKPAATAYAEVYKWLVGTRMSGCSSGDQDTWTCELHRTGGYTARILWNPDRIALFTLPDAWNVKYIRDTGGEKRGIPKSRRVEIGPSPLLFEP